VAKKTAVEGRTGGVPWARVDALRRPTCSRSSRSVIDRPWATARSTARRLPLDSTLAAFDLCEPFERLAKPSGPPLARG
jgi:hypothetical protein